MSSVAAVLAIAFPVLTYYMKVITGGSYLLLFYVFPIPLGRNPYLDWISFFLLIASLVTGFLVYDHPGASFLTALIGLCLYIFYGYTLMLISGLVSLVVFCISLFSSFSFKALAGLSVRILPIIGAVCIYLAYTSEAIIHLQQYYSVYLERIRSYGILLTAESNILVSCFIVLSALTLLAVLIALIRGARVSTAVFSLLAAIASAGTTFYYFKVVTEGTYQITATEYAAPALFIITAALALICREQKTKEV